jgi:hypothetical protein
MTDIGMAQLYLVVILDMAMMSICVWVSANRA